MAPKQALVFGASGISGWAITRECLQYPNAETFDRVIALSKQQLRKEQFLMCDASLEKLELIFGIDLMNDEEVISSQFAAITGIENTTHVFYAGQ
jgi:hypothetical protein